MVDDDDSVVVPAWVPEVAPHLRADVYPVDADQADAPAQPLRSPAELRLDRSAVTSGYAERRLGYEFASCLPATASDSKSSILPSAPPPSAPLSAPVSSAPLVDASSAVPLNVQGEPPSSTASLPPPVTGTAMVNTNTGTGTLSAHDLGKIQSGLRMLRRSRPADLQRVPVQVYDLLPPPLNDQDQSLAPEAQAASASSESVELVPGLASKKSFPMQKPSASSSLEDWFNKLSSGASFSTTELSRAVPLGPAIVRAAGKVIEMMATRSVPAQRAAWYIRIAVLNECVKQIRPDRPPPSPRSFWTRQLCVLLKTEMDSIRARKAPTLGSMDRVAFWEYVLDLARWQADECLLDLPPWLSRVTSILRAELSSTQNGFSVGSRIALSAALRFRPELVASADFALPLCEALIPAATTIMEADARDLSNGRLMSDDNQRVTGKRVLAETDSQTKIYSGTPSVAALQVHALLASAVSALDPNLTTENAEKSFADRMKTLVANAKNAISTARDQAAGGAPSGSPVHKESSLQPEDGGDVSATLVKEGRNGKTSSILSEQGSPLTAIRELERLSAHGDVLRVTAIVKSAFREKGGVRCAVSHVCEWAIRGPVNDYVHAAVTAATVISALASTLTGPVTGEATLDRSFAILDSKRRRDSVPSPSGSGTPAFQRELWLFLKKVSEEVSNSEEEAPESKRLVYFIARLCQIGEFSFSIFIKDVARLVSLGRSNSCCLVRCIATLPEPEDRSIADARRTLLRRGGRSVPSNRLSVVSNKAETVAKMVRTGDAQLSMVEGRRLQTAGDFDVILASAEWIATEEFSKLFSSSTKASNIIDAVVSFMAAADVQGVGVDWLMSLLSSVCKDTDTWERRLPTGVRVSVTEAGLRKLVDMAPVFAAAGLLEDIVNLLVTLWCQPWFESQTTSSELGSLQRELLRTSVALVAMFGANSGNGNKSWTKWVLKHAVDLDKNPPSLVTLLCALLTGDVAMKDLGVITADSSQWGPTPERDLARLSTGDSAIVSGVDAVRVVFEQIDPDSAVEHEMLQGICPNELIGGVMVPVILHSVNPGLNGTNRDGAKSADDLLRTAVKWLESEKLQLNLKAVRTGIALELVSLFLVSCVRGHHAAPAALGALICMPWMRQSLIPRGGHGMATSLRQRVDFHLAGGVQVDAVELSALLFNAMTRLTGATYADETMVAKTLGKVPLGMTEMQLSLIAAHRRECGEDEEFGSRISDVAVSMISADDAWTLTSMACICCSREDVMHIVAGLLGFAAAHAMKESLEFVSRGVTVEAQQNTSLHKERSSEWYQADTLRRAVLECVVDRVNAEVGVQIEAVLMGQMEAASMRFGGALSRGCVPGSFVGDGRRMSDTLESRLQCLLALHNKFHTDKDNTKVAVVVANLLCSTVPLMKASAVDSALQLLHGCANASERAASSGSTKPAEPVAQESPQAEGEVEPLRSATTLRKKLQKILSSTQHWVDEEQRASLRRLWNGRDAPLQTRVAAHAVDGSDVDNWVLLEGYGRGADEEAAIPPSSFGRQGERRHTPSPPAIRMKRTYSTFANLTVGRV